MPRVSTLQTCVHCGEQYIGGDCIVNICTQCKKLGHQGSSSMRCPKCEEEKLELYNKIKNSTKSDG